MKVATPTTVGLLAASALLISAHAHAHAHAGAGAGVVFNQLSISNSWSGTPVLVTTNTPDDDSNLYAIADDSPSGTPGERYDVAGGRRDAPLALYAVPEPATLGLIGLGGFAALGRRRH